jgi:HPt (histidine-containing phosphotransfer) domain-containing protein
MQASKPDVDTTYQDGSHAQYDEGSGPLPLPQPSPPLLSLEHLQGIPNPVVSRIVKPSFESVLPELFDQLEKELSGSRDSGVLHDLLHRLRGDSKCAGAAALAEALKCFDSQPLQLMPEDIIKMRALLEQTWKAMRHYLGVRE